MKSKVLIALSASMLILCVLVIYENSQLQNAISFKEQGLRDCYGDGVLYSEACIFANLTQDPAVRASWIKETDKYARFGWNCKVHSWTNMPTPNGISTERIALSIVAPIESESLRLLRKYGEAMDAADLAWRSYSDVDCDKENRERLHKDWQVKRDAVDALRKLIESTALQIARTR